MIIILYNNIHYDIILIIYNDILILNVIIYKDILILSFINNIQRYTDIKCYYTNNIQRYTDIKCCYMIHYTHLFSFNASLAVLNCLFNFFTF